MGDTQVFLKSSIKVLPAVLLLAILTTINVASATKAANKVLLMSMDGFRNDYLLKTSTPNFDKMMKEGVTMPYVDNTFVTNTFPSHYTMATGLYTESHGILANHMYDPEFDSFFDPGNTETRWWEDGEPIWITAVKEGLTAGTLNWGGSDVELQGLRPTMWIPYDESIPFETRVETVVRWLAEDDLDLCVLYFHQPDRDGHTYGPQSEEVRTQIGEMDKIAGLISEELTTAGIKDKTNLIITSDHGMAPIDMENRHINVSEYVNSSLLAYVSDRGSTMGMWAMPGQARALAEALSGVDHLHVWLKEDLPERFHNKHHRRVPHVFALADPGWMVTEGPIWGDKGDHGYDNNLNIMKPIFLATGPDFKVNHKVDPIKNVDIYPLVCHLLGITPAPNNGSLERAMTLLVPEVGSAPNLAMNLGLLVLTAVASSLQAF